MPHMAVVLLKKLVLPQCDQNIEPQAGFPGSGALTSASPHLPAATASLSAILSPRGSMTFHCHTLQTSCCWVTALAQFKLPQEEHHNESAAACLSNALPAKPILVQLWKTHPFSRDFLRRTGNKTSSMGPCGRLRTREKGLGGGGGWEGRGLERGPG